MAFGPVPTGLPAFRFDKPSTEAIIPQQAHMTAESATPSALCPKCKRRIPSDATDGLCPRCLLDLAIEDASDSLTGQTISHYEILDQLSMGGMGVVYKARDSRLGRFVAIKFMLDKIADDPDAAGRFKREALAVATLHHPNICPFFDFGDHEGRPFLVTELLEGETLDERMARDPLRSEDILDYATQMAEALKAAHAKGFVHRDIKPSNMFLTTEGEVKLLDFGLAKPLRWNPSMGASLPTLTANEAVAGTIPYMSPEQLQGKPVDPRTDFFSLGVVLYEMAAGRRPFRRDSAAETIAAIQREDPEPLHQINPDVGRPMSDLVTKLLSKDSTERHADARDLLADLAKVHTPQTIGNASRQYVPVFLGMLLSAVVLLSLIAAFWGSAENTGIESTVVPDQIRPLVGLAVGADPDAVPELCRGDVETGQYLLDQRTRESFDLALESFDRAISRCDEYAEAWAGKAHAYVVWGTAGYATEPSSGLMVQARVNVDKAIELSPDLAEAIAVRAMIRMSRDRNFEGAREDFVRAIELDPNLAETHHWYALFLSSQGELDAALNQVEMAYELDSRSALILAARGRVHYYRLEIDQAEQYYIAALQREPESVPAQLGLLILYLQQREWVNALLLVASGTATPADDIQSALTEAVTLIRDGRDEDASAHLAELGAREGRTVSELHLAVFHALQGDVDETLRWLDRATDENADYVVYIQVDPLFDLVRDDPDYDTLLEKIGLRP